MSEHNQTKHFNGPLTKKQRLQLNAMSLEVYGRPLQWQKMLRKGTKNPLVTTNNNGNPAVFNVVHHYTVQEIHDSMVKSLEELAKAKAEALTKKEADGSQAPVTT